MENGSLAQLLSQGLEQRGMTIDALAERTKVPRSTARTLLGGSDPAILPQRIYLRGFVGVLAIDLGVDQSLAFQRYDAENPTESKIEPAPESRVSRFSMAAVAAIGGIGVIAVILAFAN